MAVNTVEKYGEGGYPAVLEYKTEYEGAVLDTGEYNYYDDSDFYAVVWDGERVKRIEYATTRSYTYGNSAVIDATPEVKAQATAWLREVWTKRLKLNALEIACAPDIDKRVRCIVSRGKNKGTHEGVIFWKQEQRSLYGTWHYGWRYGVLCDDGQRRFFSDNNITVLDAPDWYYPPSEYEINKLSTDYRAGTDGRAGLIRM